MSNATIGGSRSQPAGRSILAGADVDPAIWPFVVWGTRVAEGIALLDFSSPSAPLRANS